MMTTTYGGIKIKMNSKSIESEIPWRALFLANSKKFKKIEK